MAMNMADYEAQLSEDQRQNEAAALIQRRWRDYYGEKVRGRDGSGAGGSGADGRGSTSEGREMTEQELREHLLEQVRSMLADRESLVQSNLSLQRSLAKLFADRRHAQAQEAQEPTQGLPADVEARYWASIQKLRDERIDIERKRQEAEQEIQHSKLRHKAIIDEAAQFEHNFREYVMETARSSIYPRNNKPIPAKRIEQFAQDEEQLYQQVQAVRIQYIKQRNKAKKLTAEIKEKEKMRDGMHMIDFEQLKIENTNLNEKIEERNEDLLKLRKKATTTIHVLTHVKEKLEHVKGENIGLSKQGEQLEQELSQLRDKLAQAKRERDVFVNDNLKMKEKMPMIGAEDLLLDYEVRKKEIENCRILVVNLTNEHHELMQWIKAHQPMLESMQKTAAA